MRKSALPLFLTLPLAFGACNSADSDDRSPDVVDEALLTPFAGETTADEAPSFADATLQQAEFTAEDDAVADPMAERPELAAGRHVRIAIAWGYLRPHRDAQTVVDWSGDVTATNAGLRVLRTLRFEERDMVVRPRTDVHVVEFISHTKPHADGLLLDVVLSPTLNPAGEPVTLTFNSAPFTKTITIEAGMRRSQAEVIDNEGHVVAYHIIRPDADGCTEGFLRGRWQAAGEVGGRKVGTLHGRFVANGGEIRGSLRGVFGERENGKQVWFAKVIDNAGHFLGILAGRYGDNHFAGLFIGKDAAGEKIVKGVVRGVYFDRDDDRDGGFIGRYSERCGEDASEGTAPTTDEVEIDLEDAAAL